MSAEFPSSQAREFMNDKIIVERWYLKFKDELFESIKNAALIGNNSTSIHSELWGRSELKKDYLISRLLSLDYTVKVEKGIMTISW